MDVATKKTKRSSNREIVYRCTGCGATKPRDKLTVKRAQFAEMGERAKVLRTRTVDWLCDKCRDADPDWNRERLMGSPGFKDVADGRAP